MDECPFVQRQCLLSVADQSGHWKSKHCVFSNGSVFQYKTCVTTNVFKQFRHNIETNVNIGCTAQCTVVSTKPLYFVILLALSCHSIQHYIGNVRFSIAILTNTYICLDLEKHYMRISDEDSIMQFNTRNTLHVSALA